jgi:hypothetical protein
LITQEYATIEAIILRLNPQPLPPGIQYPQVYLSKLDALSGRIKWLAKTPEHEQTTMQLQTQLNSVWPGILEAALAEAKSHGAPDSLLNSIRQDPDTRTLQNKFTNALANLIAMESKWGKSM